MADSVCVGCGFAVDDDGVLQLDLCDDGAIVCCAGCTDDGCLRVNVCEDSLEVDGQNRLRVVPVAEQVAEQVQTLVPGRVIPAGTNVPIHDGVMEVAYTNESCAAVKVATSAQAVLEFSGAVDDMTAILVVERSTDGATWLPASSNAVQALSPAYRGPGGAIYTLQDTPGRSFALLMPGQTLRVFFRAVFENLQSPLTLEGRNLIAQAVVHS